MCDARFLHVLNSWVLQSVLAAIVLHLCGVVCVLVVLRLAQLVWYVPGPKCAWVLDQIFRDKVLERVWEVLYQRTCSNPI